MSVLVIISYLVPTYTPERNQDARHTTWAFLFQSKMDLPSASRLGEKDAKGGTNQASDGRSGDANSAGAQVCATVPFASASSALEAVNRSFTIGSSMPPCP